MFSKFIKRLLMYLRQSNRPRQLIRIARRAVPALLVLYLVLASGCSTLISTAVNKKFPPRSIEAIQVSNLQDQTATLERMTRADVAVHLSSDDVDSVIRTSIHALFQEGNAPAIEGVKTLRLLSPATVSLDRQSIRSKARLYLEFESDGKPGKYIRNAEVELEGMVVPVTNDTAVVFTVSMLNFKIKKMKLRGIFQLLWVVRPVFNTFIADFRDNINGHLARNPIIIPIKIKPLPETDLAGLITSDQLTVTGNTIIKVNKKFGPVAIHIDEEGVNILAEMLDANPVVAEQRMRASAVAEEKTPLDAKGKVLRKEVLVRRYHLMKRIQSTQRMQDLHNTASRAEIPFITADAVPKYQIPTFEMGSPNEADSAIYEAAEVKRKKEKTGWCSPRRKKARKAFRTEVAAPVTDFSGLFDAYAQMFQERMLVSLDSFSSPAKTEVLIARNFVARTFNEIFLEREIALTYSGTIDQQVAPTTIRLLDKPKFNCSSVLENCSNRLSSCSQSGCGSCGKWNLLCKAKKVLCEAANAVKWAACQVANGGKYALCQAENAGRFAWCSTVWLVEYLAFEALTIGTYAASFKGEFDGSLVLRNASLGDNIESYALNTAVDVSGSYAASVVFHGSGVTSLFLCQGLNCTLREGFRALVQNPLLTGEITAVIRNNMSDVLVIGIPEIKIGIQMNNPLIAQLLLQCPQIAITCKATRILPFTFVLSLLNNPTIDKYLDVLWKGRYDHIIRPFAVNLELPAMRLPGALGFAHAKIKTRSVSLLFP
jgi:hypothetical protein